MFTASNTSDCFEIIGGVIIMNDQRTWVFWRIGVQNTRRDATFTDRLHRFFLENTKSHVGEFA